MSRNCSICSKEFTPWGARDYCSEKCKKEYLIKQAEKERIEKLENRVELLEKRLEFYLVKLGIENESLKIDFIDEL